MCKIKFKYINDQLCRMVEPEPLTPEAQFPCVVRLIQDDSPMGRSNAFHLSPLLANNGPIIIDAVKDYSVSVVFNNMIFYYANFEIIGYPVVEGSAEWAWYQGCILKNQIWNDRIKELITIYPCHTHDIQTNIILGQPMKHWENNYEGWIEQCEQYAMLTGWQLYEPQPKPKPLLADAQAGDLCKHRNGDWSQIIDTNGTYIPGQPIRTTLKDTNGINRNFCLSGSHFTMQFGGEYDIIATEPLAPKGTAEWAWQMLILQKPVSHPAEGIWRDTYYSKDGFVRCMAKTGWQLYEEKPLLADAQVGWVCKHGNGTYSTIDLIMPCAFKEEPFYRLSNGDVCDEDGTCQNPDTSVDVVSAEPLAPEGTAKWGEQMMLLRKKISNEICPKTYRYVGDDGFIVLYNGKELVKTVWHIDEWLKGNGNTHRQSGWQLYEPEPAKEPEIVAYKQHVNCLVCGKEIEGLLDGHATVSIKRYSISSLYESTYSHYCGKCFLELGFDATERELRNRQQPIAEPKPEPQPAKEPIADCDNCKHRCTKSNIDYCHMYEPQPAYAVGDWVVYNDGARIGQAKIIRIYDDLYVVVDHLYSRYEFVLNGYNITRKLKPSEVVVHIGCLSGTVEKIDIDPDMFWLGESIIAKDMLDEPTLTLVKELLEKQEGETK